MTTYTRIVTSKYPAFIVFDDDVDVDFFKEINHITESEDYEVTVDSNNCVRYYTYDNDEEELPESIDGRFFYEFANDKDASDWLDYANSDGHRDCLFAVGIVTDGVETVEYEDF